MVFFHYFFNTLNILTGFSKVCSNIPQKENLTILSPVIKKKIYIHSKQPASYLKLTIRNVFHIKEHGEYLRGIASINILVLINKIFLTIPLQ